jgi:phosphatidylserine/phosphatidylglycerophosphate/cardiolipin synthase-like enzyme
MNVVTNKNATLKINAYIGDAKTLLAFNLDRESAKNLAGFTIGVKPAKGDPYYLVNTLQFEKPSEHAQNAKLPPNSSFNAPIHKFRWLHVPGSLHQGLKPSYGTYTYTVTPRYFDESGSMQPLDPKRGVSLKVPVNPFTKGHLSTGFTRGFTQSQAFVHHFGPKVHVTPPKSDLDFDTKSQAGKDPKGHPYTYAQEYQWLGFTARDRVFEILDRVKATKSLRLAVFAYDLSEPDFVAALVALGRQKRVRIILDNAALHKTNKKTGKVSAEDGFEKRFRKADKTKTKANPNGALLRGHFGRYSHDKVLIVYDKTGPRQVLTGSTNFSVTGFYVNSNHVVVFDDRTVAKEYADVFDFAWKIGVKNAAFQKSPFANKTFSFSKDVPKTEITYSPHTEAVANKTMGALVRRIEVEGKKNGGNVLFAVMEMGPKSNSTVYTALNGLHAKQNIFTYGISDNPRGIFLYAPGQDHGLLVTGKPVRTQLPPPFDQVPNIAGQKHQIHHKFVVCGFNSADAVVYCGSSNLANKGETVNGDNLVAIHDKDVATVFAIEAVGLVDHFNFLDKYQRKAKVLKGKKPKTPPTSPKDAAVQARWFLSTNDGWTKPYFDRKDLHCRDRVLFG